MVTGGPLVGIKVLELAGIGPAPFACMLLTDLGCDVLRVERPGGGTNFYPAEYEILLRGRTTVTLDLRSDEGRDTMLEGARRADVLVEGFRPGVMERLRLGPSECRAVNDRLIYARMTGWGQDGPLAPRAGHDINYLALSGALSLIGQAGQKPVVPINLVADFGGGGMLLVNGVLAALLERERSGTGQVVDAAMVDGVALLLAMARSFHNAGAWREARGTNLLDGGAPFYDTYVCADGHYVAIGALEPAFYTAFLDGVSDVADTSAWPEQYDTQRWPELRAAIAATFLRRTRIEWAQRFADTDACVTPVLTLQETATHPHLQRRGAYAHHPAGGVQPQTAPRFSRTPGVLKQPVDEALARWGLDDPVE